MGALNLSIVSGNSWIYWVSVSLWTILSGYYKETVKGVNVFVSVCNLLPSNVWSRLLLCLRWNTDHTGPLWQENVSIQHLMQMAQRTSSYRAGIILLSEAKKSAHWDTDQGAETEKHNQACVKTVIKPPVFMNIATTSTVSWFHVPLQAVCSDSCCWHSRAFPCF